MKSLGATTPRTGRLQRISASRPVGTMSSQVEGGLVDEEELAVRERPAQVHLQLHAALDEVLHVRLEDDVPVLAVPLGPVHRDVGVAQQSSALARSPIAMPMLAVTVSSRLRAAARA